MTALRFFAYPKEHKRAYDMDGKRVILDSFWAIGLIWLALCLAIVIPGLAVVFLAYNLILPKEFFDSELWGNIAGLVMGGIAVGCAVWILETDRFFVPKYRAYYKT
ncbi:MAG TPA: hypothetical protein VNA68_02810 [Candidatus Dormibacteraeota bacterium]|nr:hypothetical protein [Candidatus Dormibacteraeota bacterium]